MCLSFEVIISITQIEEERMKAGLSPSRKKCLSHRGGLLALLRLRKKG